MGIFAEFTDEHGRRCRVYDGAGGLAEVQRNYEECGLSADEEQGMEDVMIGPRDTLRFSHGQATGAELVKFAERAEAVRVATRFVDDGLGTFQQGLEKYLRLHPGARARLAGVGQSVEDLLKKRGATRGYTVVDETGTRYHVSGAPPKAEEQDEDESDLVTVVPRGPVNYVIHGRVAAHAKPGSNNKSQEAEEARKKLWRRANELSKMSPSDAMLQAVLEHPELLEILVKEREQTTT